MELPDRREAFQGTEGQPGMVHHVESRASQILGSVPPEVPHGLEHVPFEHDGVIGERDEVGGIADGVDAQVPLAGRGSNRALNVQEAQGREFGDDAGCGKGPAVDDDDPFGRTGLFRETGEQTPDFPRPIACGDDQRNLRGVREHRNVPAFSEDSSSPR